MNGYYLHEKLKTSIHSFKQRR